MKASDLLFIAEKIEYGIRDHETSLHQFDPLWKSAFLLDTFKQMLRAFLYGRDPEDYAKSFEVVCHFTYPEFHTIVSKIERMENA